MQGLEQGGDAPENVKEVAEAIVDLVSAPAGTTAFRVHLDPWNDGAKTVDAVKDLVRRVFYEGMGLANILKVKQNRHCTTAVTARLI